MVDPEQLHIESLAGYCAEASQKRERNQLIYCYELFRRAFDTADQEAWTILNKQYHKLICSWIIKVGAGRFDNDAVGDLANDALAKFWRTISKKLPLGDHFSDTSQLLSYLNRCTTSVVHDVNRRQQTQRRVAELAELDAALPQHAPTLEAKMAQEDGRTAQIDTVRRWVDQNVTDEQELLLLKLLFEQGLKPRDVIIHHPEQFPDIRSVRRLRERILKRARRSPLFGVAKTTSTSIKQAS